MRLAGKIAVVTGAAQGIGEAMAERFMKEGAKGVAVVDLQAPRAEAVAKRIGARAYACDVGNPLAMTAMVEAVERDLGPIDLFCSNAGVALADPDQYNVASAPDAEWAREWAVNVMAHVYAARVLVPRMSSRGGGYFLNTASAAGLLSQIGSAPYSTTKHAAIGFAESLAITHRDDGIRVSVLCPQGVDTPLLRSVDGGSAAIDGVISAEQVAETVIEGLAAERFLILPHPQVVSYCARKASDYDRWLAGMAKLRRSLLPPRN